ncbi:Uncharacterized protein Zm00014a_033772 [Zea mays]|uniref:Glycine-rich protein n=2 Tax=Zea mays TaxID=4577 RepID=A0A1D6HK92_MAIZE|nr:glycine-rich protein [Zea mays]PWZ20263.1 Uncharacterized protein Zm00014a_033772 [Zea mays]
MAGVFWGGGRADEVADFDEYDPTPYGGGYDIALTFGRPLPPSEETCYPISTASSYDRPQQHGGRRPGAEESHGSAAGYGGGGGGYAGAGRPHQLHKEEETHGYGRKGGHDDDHEQQAYRKPKPSYGHGDGDDDHQAYRKPKPSYGDERPSSGRKKKNDDDDDSDDDGARKPRYKKKDDDDSDDDDRKKRYEKNDRRRRHDYDD